MMPRIRVLHLISSISFGGAERVVCELANQLATKSLDVTVGIIGHNDILFHDFSSQLRGDFVEVIQFNCNSPLSFSCLSQIIKYTKINDVRCVHSHGYKSDVYAYLASFFIANKIVLVATNHNWLVNSFFEKVYKFIDLIVLRRFSHVIAVSSKLFDEMKLLGIRSNRLKIIDNGIDISNIGRVSRELVRTALQLTPSVFAVGCVASLTLEKSHHSLIRTLCEYKEELCSVKLIFVGDGPLRLALEQLAHDSGLQDQVLFLGHRSDVHELYAAFDAFALVSEKEGLPMALLEAMAARLPAVVTAVGAIPHVVTDSEQGFLVKVDDSAEIASALIKLIENPELRAVMGQAAYVSVTEHYSSKRMAREYEGLYLDLMDRL